MVAIYIPVLASPSQIYTHVPKPFIPDYKTAFMLRALHACDEAKDHQITCLGTAVTYHRRCRNPLRMDKCTAVLAEMVEAAEDGYALLGDLRFLAGDWAAGLSCYLHGAQKGVAMAALGAVALYRLTFPADVRVPGFDGLSVGGVDWGTLEHCAKSDLYPKTDSEALGLSAKNVEQSDAGTKGSPGEIDAKPANKLHQLGTAILAHVQAVLELCWSVLLLCARLLLELEAQ